MFGFSKEQRDRRQRDANSTTMMLIVVIAVFLAVELPLSTMTALHTISSRYGWVSLIIQLLVKAASFKLILTLHLLQLVVAIFALQYLSAFILSLEIERLINKWEV